MRCVFQEESGRFKEKGSLVQLLAQVRSVDLAGSPCDYVSVETGIPFRRFEKKLLLKLKKSFHEGKTLSIIQRQDSLACKDPCLL